MRRLFSSKSHSSDDDDHSTEDQGRDSPKLSILTELAKAGAWRRVRLPRSSNVSFSGSLNDGTSSDADRVVSPLLTRSAVLSPRISALYKDSHDAIFSSTAALQVPDSVGEMRIDELEHFRLLMEPDRWYTLNMAMFKLGTSLHIFPLNVPMSGYQWIFADPSNVLHRRLRRLLAQLGKEDLCEIENSVCRASCLGVVA
jgi:hypothetical protein